jgi:hypothetical protein
MTTAEVQQLLGVGSSRAARVQLARWSIEAAGRDVTTGEKLWPAGLVCARAATRPGRGARTDLQAPLPAEAGNEPHRYTRDAWWRKPEYRDRASRLPAGPLLHVIEERITGPNARPQRDLLGEAGAALYRRARRYHKAGRAPTLAVPQVKALCERLRIDPQAVYPQAWHTAVKVVTAEQEADHNPDWARAAFAYAEIAGVAKACEHFGVTHHVLYKRFDLHGLGRPGHAVRRRSA